MGIQPVSCDSELRDSRCQYVHPHAIYLDCLLIYRSIYIAYPSRYFVLRLIPRGFTSLALTPVTDPSYDAIDSATNAYELTFRYCLRREYCTVAAGDAID